MKKISFIIPCKNEVKYIEETISSVLCQKDLNTESEIIIVDGLSDDGTREILSDLQKKDSRIIVINNEKKITPVALNLGVKKATGDYIFILGAHAKIASDYVANCLQIFEKHNDVSCAGGPITSVSDSALGKAIAIAMSSSIGVGNAKHRFPEYEGYAEMACFPVFKKKVFDQIGYFDEELVRNQDDDFCFRLRLNGGKVYVSPKAKSFYYVRDSLKKLFNQYYQYGFWRIALLKKHKLPIAIRQQVPFIFFSMILILFFIGFIFNDVKISLALPVLYLLTLILYTLGILILKKKLYALWLPIVIFTLHFSYGLGFALGIIKNLSLKRANKN
jgi:GT2 family glycosyltransferase